MRLLIHALLLTVLAAGCRTAGDAATVREGDEVPSEPSTAGDQAPPAANDCSKRWEVFSSKPYEQIALPDTHVNYWRIRYKVPAGQPVALRVRGTFPKARYSNFNVYDQKTQNASASVADFRIVPDEGAVNPFLPGFTGGDARTYTVWSLPGAAVDGEEANIIRQPKAADGEAEQLLELWYRVYVPDAGTDDQGGAPLPTVEAFTDQTAATPVACPEKAELEPSILNALGSLPPENPVGSVFMYRSRATGLYGNLDNIYLGTRLRLLGGSVVVLKVKPPQAAVAGKALTGREDVRYWSFCLGGLDQRTSACLFDAEAKADAKGFVTLTIGPDDLKDLATQRGQNFLPWGKQLFQVLVYRNLLTKSDFEGSVQKVKSVEAGSTFEADTLAAQKFIGERAPQGRKCTKLVYRLNNCGVR